jgi:hypothetical protein
MRYADVVYVTKYGVPDENTGRETLYKLGAELRSLYNEGKGPIEGFEVNLITEGFDYLERLEFHEEDVKILESAAGGKPYLYVYICWDLDNPAHTKESFQDIAEAYKLQLVVESADK